ncbi:MAG: hypothetical protein ACREVB_08820 [Burkholderiales bacterium]
MARLAVPLSLVALAALSACSTPPQSGGPAQSSPNIVTNVHPYHAGNGTVQSVMPAPGSSDMQRLEIKMDNGPVQYVDTSAREFTKGSRVQLSQDRLITKM